MKSQALSVLQQFQPFVSTQFQATIKIVHFDNALEFHSTPCQSFFQSLVFFIKLHVLIGHNEMAV